jgi:hypothetical protein
MSTALLILSMLLTSQHSMDNATVDVGTYALQIGGGTLGAAVGATAARVPFQAALLIMTASGVDIDPAENRLALGIMLTGVAAAGAGYCLGAAYTTRWIGEARDHEGSWDKDLLYSFVGGAAFAALTGGALLVRRKSDSPLLPMSMITLGLFAPSVGGTIGYNSRSGQEPAAASTQLANPGPSLRVPLLQIALK